MNPFILKKYVRQPRRKVYIDKSTLLTKATCVTMMLAFQWKSDYLSIIRPITTDYLLE